MLHTFTSYVYANRMLINAFTMTNIKKNIRRVHSVTS